MPEDKNKCISPLLQTIINKLDPIILHGYVSNETPSPTETPEPTSSPQTNEDIDNCIDIAIGEFKRELNNSYPDITIEQMLSFWDNSNACENWVNEYILEVAKEYTQTNSIVNFLNDVTSSFSSSNTLFKPGETYNPKPLIIPILLHSSNLKITYTEYQYVNDWDVYVSFNELVSIKGILLTQFFNCYFTQKLLALRNKTNVDKQTLALKITTNLQELLNNMHFTVTLNNNWADSNLIEQSQGREVSWSNRLITNPNIIPKSLSFTAIYNSILNVNMKLQQCIAK